MTLNLGDVVALAHAGFSKEQIMSFAQPVAQPIAQPVAQPVAQPIAQPIAQPFAQPIAQPVAQPVAQPIAQPVAQPIAQPIAQPVAQPVAQPIAQPIAQPVAQPVAPNGLSDNQFAQLLQTINSANATIDIPPTVSVDDKLAEHFTAMLVGEKKSQEVNK